MSSDTRPPLGKIPHGSGGGDEDDYSFGKKEKIIIGAMVGVVCLLIYNYIQLESTIPDIYKLDPKTDWNCGNLLNYTKFVNLAHSIDPTHASIPQTYFDQLNEKKSELGCTW